MARTIHSEGQNALIRALIEARKSANLTQTDLAERLRCHQSLVARIESGQRRIDVAELVILCRALDIEASSILSVVENAVEADVHI